MNILKNPGLLLRAFIAIAYVILGILIINSPISAEVLSKTLKYCFGVLLIVYGLFRSYRAYQLYNDLKDEQ